MLDEENPWIKRTRFLTQALVLSGAVNICLVATLIYTAFVEKQEALTGEMKVEEFSQNLPVRTNEEILHAYSFLPFSELLLRLEHGEPIEEGLCKRDIALACLVAFHHFPLEKSLGGVIPQKRQISMRNQEGQEAIAVNVFPGLSDFQFQAILQFAKTEKWPLTSQGLFYELKRQENAYDPSLLETFYLTPEFHLVSTLFFKTGLPLTKGEVVSLLVSGEWNLLDNWARSHKEEGADLSVDARRGFLLAYLNKNSAFAAELLFKSDPEFCLKKLSDSEILYLLAVLKAKQIPCEHLVHEIALSPRIDAVREFAKTLYPSQSMVVAPIEKAPEVKTSLVANQPDKKKIFHTVGQGENLWKIARKYHVTVEALMRHNHLESDKVKPGKKLEIPS